MRTAAVLVALCLGLASSAPIEEVVAVAVPVPAVVTVPVDQAEEAFKLKGFFEDLSQISQNIIAHAHKLAEQIISSIEETAKNALNSLQQDRPNLLPIQPVMQPTVQPAVQPAVVPPTSETVSPASSDIAVDVFKRKEEMGSMA